MNVARIFLETAKQFPKHIALIEKGDSISYEKLNLSVMYTAAYFKSKGIAKGDRVLVFVPMGINLYRILLALFYLGATAVFIDDWVDKKRLAVCCKLADCKGFIGSTKAQLLRIFSKEIRRIPVKLKVSKRIKTKLEICTVDTNDAALITFTTGSTGKPKAALRSHYFLNEQLASLKKVVKPKSNAVALPLLPIVTFINLAAGTSSLIAHIDSKKPIYKTAEKLSHQIKKHAVNQIIASPYIIKALAEYCLQNDLKLKSLNAIFTGGAPVFPNEAKLYNAAFSGSTVSIVYGSTEAEPISEIDSKILEAENLKKGLLVGAINDGLHLKIIPVSNQSIEAKFDSDLVIIEKKENEIGEVIVAGKHVLKSYFRNNDAFLRNKIVTKNNVWHRTGDSGFLKDGKLYLTGRCKQLIKIDKGYISPFVVENHLEQIKGVEKGTLLEKNGKLVCAVVGSIDSKDLSKILMGYQFDAIQIVDKMPMDPRHQSKIDYEKLKELLDE